MDRIFAVTRSRGMAWNDARPPFQKWEGQEDWPAHAAFMDDLESEGFVLLGGPLEGTRDALLIIRADAEQIEARLADDPWTSNYLLKTTSVVPWTLRLGSLE